MKTIDLFEELEKTHPYLAGTCENDWSCSLILDHACDVTPVNPRGMETWSPRGEPKFGFGCCTFRLQDLTPEAIQAQLSYRGYFCNLRERQTDQSNISTRTTIAFYTLVELAQRLVREMKWKPSSWAKKKAKKVTKKTKKATKKKARRKA